MVESDIKISVNQVVCGYYKGIQIFLNWAPDMFIYGFLTHGTKLDIVGSYQN